MQQVSSTVCWRANPPEERGEAGLGAWRAAHHIPRRHHHGHAGSSASLRQRRFRPHPTLTSSSGGSRLKLYGVSLAGPMRLMGIFPGSQRLLHNPAQLPPPSKHDWIGFHACSLCRRVQSTPRSAVNQAHSRGVLEFSNPQPTATPTPNHPLPSRPRRR